MPNRYLMDRTAALVAAYVSRNSMPVAELPVVIARVHAALSSLAADRGAADTYRAAPITPTGAEVAASIKHDGIVSFIDGRQYKSLKRHLTANGMTPDLYRASYNLPKDYPMVSPAYAAVRSRIARDLHRVVGVE